MLVFVNMLTGRRLEIEIEPVETVRDLKEKIYDMERIRVDQQRLLYNSKQLEDEHALVNYDIGSEATIQLVIRLSG